MRLIDADAAIDAVSESLMGVFVEYEDIAKKIIDKVPSAIIQCEECIYLQYDEIFDAYWCRGRSVKPDHYCGYAIRREEIG